jgi:hypothetical protein
MDTATYIATTASLDRHAAAQAWAERQWPENDHLVNNARLDELVRAAVSGAHERNAEDAHLIVPSADVVVPVGPDTDLVGALRRYAPDYAVCDHCDGVSGPVAGLLPLTAPPQIVALALCEDCLVLLATVYPAATFVFLTPERTAQ